MNKYNFCCVQGEKPSFWTEVDGSDIFLEVEILLNHLNFEYLTLEDEKTFSF